MTEQKNFWVKAKFFRKNYSTNACFWHLTNIITTGFEKCLFTGMILIDLQKAFDTSDYPSDCLLGLNPITMNENLK